MKLILTIVIVLLSLLVSFGQYATISDRDGFVHLRKSPEVKNNVLDKISNAEIVYCFDSKEEKWRMVDYLKKGETISGFIHGSRLINIDHYGEVKPNLKTSSTLTFKIAEVTITMTVTDFEATKHKLNFSKKVANFLEKINGATIWGTDGNIPKKQYGQILLQTGSSIIKLPKENLYEPNLSATKVNFNADSNTIYLTALNSDGAGTYEVLWVIKDGKFIKQIIAIPF